MNGNQDLKSARKVEHFTTMAHDRNWSSDQALRRCCSKRDDELRRYRCDFAHEPHTAAHFDFAGVRALVQPPLAARLKLEVLDRIRHVDARAVHAGLSESLVQDGSGRPHERMSREVLTVSRLFAYKHDLRVGRPLSKYGLGCVFP